METWAAEVQLGLSSLCEDRPCLSELSLHPRAEDSPLSCGYGQKEHGCLWTWPGSSGSLGPGRTQAQGLLFPLPPPMAERQGLLRFTATPAPGGHSAPRGLGRGIWEGSGVHTPTLSCPLTLSPQLRKAAVLRTAVEAEAAAGVWPRVPLWAQPPSIAEWSTDLHYRFPAPSQGEKKGGPEGLPPLTGLGVPHRVRTAPGARLPWEPQPHPPPTSPAFSSPPEPTSLGSQALRLPQVSLAAACAGPAPIPGAGGPSWLL